MLQPRWVYQASCFKQVCVKHGALVRFCSHDGCLKKFINYGVCVKHGALVRF